MEKALHLDVILGEFAEEDPAWVLRDSESGKYVTIPHPRYPKRQIFHFFMSVEDAKRVAEALLAENPALKVKDIYPCEVKLKEALRGLAVDPVNGFVVHTPNEVFEFLRERLN